MKKLTFYLITGVFSICLLNACSNDKKKKQKQMKARQDSLRQVQQRMDSLAAARADSLAAARADSIAAANAVNDQGKPVFNPQAHNVSFSNDGEFAVQTGAWRSKKKANRLAQQWQKRGFEHAYTIKYGTKSTGNIWFRVRLGKFTSKAEAKKVQTWLQKKYQQPTWINHI